MSPEAFFIVVIITIIIIIHTSLGISVSVHERPFCLEMVDRLLLSSLKSSAESRVHSASSLCEKATVCVFFMPAEEHKKTGLITAEEQQVHEAS